MSAVGVLATADYYLPGHLAGGPIRTISGMVEALRGDVAFSIVTRDRDIGAAAPYPGVPRDRWVDVGGARVRYLAPAALTPWTLRRVVAEVRPEVLYLNSLFSARFSIALLALRRARARPAAAGGLAPRGELAPGALALRPGRKRAYLAAARRGGLFDGVLWHASSAFEEAQVRAWIPGARVAVAPNLAAPAADPPPRAPKQPGALRLAFLGRLARNKGLADALAAVARLRGAVHLDVYGPPEDAAYAEACRHAAAALPAGVTATFHGALPHADVAAALARADALLLPTHGENFGHAILEALQAGCPVVVSDRTPWRDLEAAGVGWDLPLERPEAFVAALQRLVELGPDEHAAMSARARRLAAARRDDADVRARNRALFVDAAGRPA